MIAAMKIRMFRKSCKMLICSMERWTKERMVLTRISSTISSTVPIPIIFAPIFDLSKPSSSKISIDTACALTERQIPIRMLINGLKPKRKYMRTKPIRKGIVVLHIEIRIELFTCFVNVLKFVSKPM